IGVDATMLLHLFESFRQGAQPDAADNQSSDAMMSHHGGLGLGLAIAKRLVEMHGGTIAASSAGLGKGATFTVTLPFVAIRQAAEQPAKPPPAKQPSPSAREAATVSALQSKRAGQTDHKLAGMH